MIKFFRKIRQNLLTENKTSKYFKYAFGEIILVVIGILIALQINNWNTARQNDHIRDTLLVKLNGELDYNINRLNTITDLYTNILDKNIELYDTLIKGINQSNLEVYMNHTFFSASRLNLSSSTFEQMKNTGNLHTLSSDILLNAIEAYYKLCEREDHYIVEINKVVTQNTFNEINKGMTKAFLDYKVNGLAYALKKNGWLLDSESEEYAELRREFFLTNQYLNNILYRIDKIINESNNLKELIKKK